MLFKNANVYKFEKEFDWGSLEELLRENELQDCGEDEILRTGWLPLPDREEQNYAIVVDDALFIRAGVSEKKIKPALIKQEAERRATQLGIDPSDRERMLDVRAVVTNELVKKIPPERRAIDAYIDIKEKLLVIDAASESQSKYVTSALRKLLQSFEITPYNAAESVSVDYYFTRWVQEGIPLSSFDWGEYVQLKENIEKGAVARYQGIRADSKEVLNTIGRDEWRIVEASFVHSCGLEFRINERLIFKRLKSLTLNDNEDEGLDSRRYLLVARMRRLLKDFSEMVRVY